MKKRRKNLKNHKKIFNKSHKTISTVNKTVVQLFNNIINPQKDQFYHHQISAKIVKVSNTVNFIK
jgi:hypothetical protein